MRKELAAGQTRWTNIDLQLRERGFVEVSKSFTNLNKTAWDFVPA